MKAKSIRQLVEHALESNMQAEFQFSTLPASQAKVIEQFVHEDLTGAARIIDTYGIRHTLSSHGFSKTENQRGQIAVTMDDFDLLPMIVKHPDKIEYGGKNRLKQDIIRYTKRIDNIYVMVEAIRFSKKGNKLVFQTMYKKR